MDRKEMDALKDRVLDLMQSAPMKRFRALRGKIGRLSRKVDELGSVLRAGAYLGIQDGDTVAEYHNARQEKASASLELNNYLGSNEMVGIRGDIIECVKEYNDAAKAWENETGEIVRKLRLDPRSLKLV